MSSRGMVYLLGAGPGDPELITERARRRLAEADIVLYDALIHPDLLRHARPGAELVFVGKRAGRASERQSAINQRMVDEANAGRVVARLKGGDPFLFGRGSEEAEHLAGAGVSFEVVPGVPSPLAATAYAGISLSHRDLASSIAYLTATESAGKDQSAHDWAKLATATQTLVIFMGTRKLESLMQLLIDHGRPPDCPAAVIQSASLPTQRTIVGSVATIAALARDAGVGMPALTVVGEVIRLREHLRWYDNRPLFGKRVLITRPRAQAASMAQALRDAGADPLLLPAIRIEPPADPGALREAAARAGSYAWIAFTSRNGVAAFFDEVWTQGGDARRIGDARIAAIGPATAAELGRFGVRADCVPEEYRGEAVARAIETHHGGSLEGVKILLPRAAVAREALPEQLRAAGAVVDVVEAYRTFAMQGTDAEALRAAVRESDVVTFTSTSTFESTFDALGEEAVERLAERVVASIGPITTEAAERRGVRVDVTATEYTVPGLLAALEAHLA